jgi:RND family efflux transporter MFP subunit
MKRGADPMKKSQMKQTIGWAAASLVLAVIVGVSLVVLAGGYRPSPVAFGQTDNKSTVPADESGSGAPTVRVKTIRPTREHLKRASTQPAHVEPYERADLFAKIAGYLEKVHVDIGARVKKDQVLAVLSVPEMEQERVQKEALVERVQADVGQAEAGQKAATAMVTAARTKTQEASAVVAKHEAEVTYHQGEYARNLQLFKDRAVQGDVVDKELNQWRAAEAALTAAKAAVATAEANLKVEQAKLLQAQAAVVGANARLKVAQADLQHAVILLRYSKITAPYDGVITHRLVHPGWLIQSGATGKADPLFTITRVDRLRIVTEIPESDSAWIKNGQPATLQVDAARGQRFAGKVARLADALDKKSHTMLVEVELDAPTELLRAGMYGSVTITLADYPDALLLPTGSLLAGGDKPSVMIVRGGKAHQQEIGVGYNDGIRIQVTRGLKGDAQIITDGKNMVREGQPVEVAK